MKRKTQYLSTAIPILLSSSLLFSNIAIADVDKTNLSRCHDNFNSNIEYCQDYDLEKSNLGLNIIDSLPVFILIMLGIFLIYVLYNIVMIIIIMLQLIIIQIKESVHRISKK